MLFNLGIGKGIEEGFHSLNYSTVQGNKPIDSGISMLIDQNNGKQCKKIFGFDGLFCAPDSLNNGIDPFYGLSSSSTCAGSGLTKTGGNLCLNDTTYGLLTTRGGNSGGKDSVIG
jgi:hypothetical protein